MKKTGMGMKMGKKVREEERSCLFRNFIVFSISISISVSVSSPIVTGVGIVAIVFALPRILVCLFLLDDEARSTWA